MRFQFEGQATFAQMHESARGYVFFTAHLGNYVCFRDGDCADDARGLAGFS